VRLARREPAIGVTTCGRQDASMIRGSDSLGRTRLLASLGAEDVRALDARCTWRKVNAGEWVIDYQSDGTDVFFVLSGHARVVIGSSGREIILHDIYDGEYFGELSAIDGRPRSAGILAITDTVVARMPSTVFREAIHRHPSVCDQILATLVAEVRALDTRTTEQAHFDVRERLCAELLRLSRTNSEGRRVISPPPTHAELAARISSHREAVTKLLNALEREGVISRSRGAVTLVDADRLTKIVAEAAEG
jgi:CRP/FNR family transcriptional regulator, cyclic AMP receptor protein